MNILELPTASFCALPWVSAAVGTTGQVVPCCLWLGREEKYARDHSITTPSVKDGIESARNSKFFKTIREQMLNGEKPSGCSYCWEQEANKHNKHLEKFQRRYENNRFHTKDAIYTTNPNPTQYLETAISNVCNFACVMCNSKASSIIWGAYHKGVSVPKGFAESIDNLDEDLSELKLLKIVGGEPMIEKKHDNLLEMILKQNKTPNELVIEYHTNASVFPSERIINQWKKTNKVRIIFSMDSVGKYAKMQRPGNYKWQDIEDTVDKYIQLQHAGVPIIFCANITLTALNIESITETCDWLYNKLKDSKFDWFNCNTIDKQGFKYIDFRNFSKETKQQIKDKWKKWEDSNPLVLDTAISRIYKIAKESIDETGLLDEPLTKELMLKNHHHVKLWKSFKQDLTELNI
jgi:molybdenum cofactor biosynthesis enzyme MoaA